MKKILTLAMLLASLSPQTIAAEEPHSESGAETSEDESATEERSPKALKRITVVESEADELTTAGSAMVVEGEELERQKTGTNDIHRILRQVPGVNIQEEDGYGLRPNIGFRGVPNERNGKITVMEDSILIAPAPYSAPSAYYFPNIGKMEAVEVVKGASQIKYGPYTTGGALNLRTREIPEEFSVRAKIAAGTDNTKKMSAALGDAWKYGGVLLETHQLETDGFKELDSGGETGFDVEDYNLKVRLNSDPDAKFYQEVTYKFGVYDELSNETYLGLTDEDFSDNPFRRYSGSQRDQMNVDHLQHHVRHYVELSDSLDLTTLVYHNDTKRNWYKVDSVGGESISSILDRPAENQELLDWIRGADSEDGAFTVRANRREYESKGVQSTVGIEGETGPLAHNIEVSARFHSDEEDRFQNDDKYTMVNGTLVLDSAGKPGAQANRVGSADAWAFYAADAITFDRLTVTPALRYERINYTREEFGKEDPDRTGVELSRSDTNINSVIPALGLSYAITETLQGFAGIHKGFSPPGPQGSSDVKEEESINYEIGTRYHEESLKAELVGFYADYDNLLGADTLSSGGEGTGDLFNAGEVTVYGVEASVGYDLAAQADVAFRLPFLAAYTFTRATFDNSFESEFFGDVQDGDELTYVPKHQMFASLGFELEKFGVFFDATYVDSMKTIAGDSDAVSSETDSHVVFDVSSKYELIENVSLVGSVDNVFDREYVVARRPAGARPGLPLTALVGLEFDF